MQLLRYISYVLFFTFSPFALSMFPHALTKIEFEIFKREVGKLGVEAIKNKIAQTPNPAPIHDGLRFGFKLHACLTATSKFYLTETSDPLATLIFETINQQEAQNGYIPKPIVEHTDNAVCVTSTNNKLGHYTKYKHEQDNDGQYITCKSTFNDKQALERAFMQIKNEQ